MLRSFIKDSVIYTLPTIVSRGLSIILVPLYTRVLTPADYGIFDLLLVFASIVNLTIPLEIGQAVARFFPAETDQEKKVSFFSTAFWFTLAIYSIFAFFAISLGKDLSSLVLQKEGITVVFQLGIIYIWINGIMLIVQNQLRWELKSKKYAISSLIFSISTAIVAVVLAYILKLGLVGLLVGMIVGVAFSLIYCLYALKGSIKLQFNSGVFKKMLLFSAPLIPSGIAVFLNTYVDRLMINHFLGLEAVGLYGVGIRIAAIVGLVMVGINYSLYPLVYTHYKEINTPFEIARIFRFFVFISLLFYVGITLFAFDILVVMTTPAFYDGAGLVIYMIPSMLLAQSYNFAPGVFLEGKTVFVMWINIAGAILNLLLNYLLIQWIGINGAAISTLSVSFLVFLSYMILNQKYYSIPHQWTPIIISIIASVTVCIIIPHLHGNIIQRVAINLFSISVLIVMFFSLNLVKMNELTQLKQITLNKLKVRL